MDNVLEAKRLLAQVRQDHFRDIRRLDLERWVEFFDTHVREHARPAEAAAFDNLARAAERSIDSISADFEGYLRQINDKCFDILWRQDWFVVDRFKRLAASPYLFPDKRQHAGLVAAGAEALTADAIDKLRRIVDELDHLKIGSGSESDILAAVNIVRN